MEITHLIDDYGDDIFALALITTKSFTSAKKVFAQVMMSYSEIPDGATLYDIILKAYPLCKSADINDSAVTLTGLELDARKQHLLEELLQMPFIFRSVIHLYWENDLEPERISAVTGQSVKTVKSVLEGLPDEISEELDKIYKDICVEITAEDKLKAYVIRSVATGKKRQFEVEHDAVPRHTWTKKQKIATVIIAAILTVAVCIVIPILDSYYQMRREENFESYENVATDEIFRYTYEVTEES